MKIKMEECTIMGKLSYMYWTRGHVDKPFFISEIKAQGGPRTDELQASDVAHGRGVIRGMRPLDAELVGVHFRGKDSPVLDITRVFWTVPEGGP